MVKTCANKCSDWLADIFRQQSAKEISEKSGQGQRAGRPERHIGAGEAHRPDEGVASLIEIDGLARGGKRGISPPAWLPQKTVRSANPAT